MNKANQIWEQIYLEKEVQPIVDRILSEYNIHTIEGITSALRQAVWEGICKAKWSE